VSLSPSTKYVLEALIPYSRANLRLTYKPSTFFYELEKLSREKTRTLQSAYYRAIKKGLIELDDQGCPRLTEKGRLNIARYKPKTLGKDAYLVVVFDIDESDRFKRTHLRALLIELSFKKVQQSVWMTRYDHRAYLAMEIREYGLERNAKIYEAIEVTST
jgi:CRISPR-associated endonuclease Cas2